MRAWRESISQIWATSAPSAGSALRWKFSEGDGPPNGPVPLETRLADRRRGDVLNKALATSASPFAEKRVDWLIAELSPVEDHPLRGRAGRPAAADWPPPPRSGRPDARKSIHSDIREVPTLLEVAHLQPPGLIGRHTATNAGLRPDASRTEPGQNPDAISRAVPHYALEGAFRKQDTIPKPGGLV